MKKMQNVSFRNVEEFLDFLPEGELEIVEYLREIILECIPECKEKLSYNVPFYKRYHTICFLWPASVLWGKKNTYEGVRLGFSKGYLMQDEISYLERGNRKQVYYRNFKSLADIDEELLMSYIFQAVELDEALKSQ